MGNSPSLSCMYCFPTRSETTQLPSNSEVDKLLSSQSKGMPSLDTEHSTSTSSAPEDVTSLEADIDEGTGAPQVDREELLKVAEGSYDRFVEVVSKPVVEAEGFSLTTEQDGVKVYTKDLPNGFVIRSEWCAPFQASDYLEFLGNLEKRKDWDKNIDEMKLVLQLTPEIGIYYQSYKKVFYVTARDLVLLCKKGKLDKALVEMSTSIETSLCPAKKDYVRAAVGVAGYYVEPVGESECRVVSYSEGSLGGSLPKSLVKRMSATNVPVFVKTVHGALTAELGKGHK